MSPSLEHLVVKNPILLVEDDSAAAELIANFLKKRWYSVKHALSYCSAGALFGSNKFSAALFDTLIPRCDDDLKSELWKSNTFFWPFQWVALAKIFKYKYPGIPISSVLILYPFVVIYGKYISCGRWYSDKN